jgi:hypothetical protein
MLPPTMTFALMMLPPSSDPHKRVHCLLFVALG